MAEFTTLPQLRFCQQTEVSMSDALAIEWGDREIAILQGRASGRQVHVRNAMLLAWPDEIDPARDEERAGEWLKGELTSHGFNVREAIVSLPRESVVIRHLELPGIPDEELPDMVRLQAATKVTLAADKYLLDFVPLPPRDADQRDVLMATVPTEVSTRVCSVLTAAGLEVQSLGVSAFHCAEMAIHLQDAKTRAANQLHLIVSLAGNRVDVVLMRGAHTLTAQSNRLDGVGEDLHRAVNAEVNRVRLSAQKLHGGLPISHIWVAPSGSDGQKLCDYLKDKLHCEGTCFDPLGNDTNIPEDQHGYFTAPAGHLYARHGALSEAVNFLDPRKAVQKRDTRKLRMALGAAGVIGVLGAGYYLFQSNLRNKEQQVADISAEAAEINKKLNLDANKDLQTAAGFVRRWQSHANDQLAHLQRIQGLLPGGDLMIVDQIDLLPGRGDHQAQVHLEGIARSADEVNDFTKELNRAGYVVQAPGIVPSRRDEDYVVQFTIDAHLPAAPADS